MTLRCCCWLCSAASLGTVIRKREDSRGAPCPFLNSLKHTRLLAPGTRQRDGVVGTLEEGIEFDGGLSAAGKRALCVLALGAQPTESAAVGTGVLAAVLPPEIVENENILLAVSVLVQAIGNGCCGRLVDNTENVQTRVRASALGSLTPRIVEVGRHCSNSLLYILTDEGLGDFLHLHQHHGGGLLWVEGLLGSLVAHLNKGVPAAQPSQPMANASCQPAPRGRRTFCR